MEFVCWFVFFSKKIRSDNNRVRNIRLNVIKHTIVVHLLHLHWIWMVFGMLVYSL